MGVRAAKGAETPLTGGQTVPGAGFSPPFIAGEMRFQISF